MLPGDSLPLCICGIGGMNFTDSSLPVSVPSRRFIPNRYSASAMVILGSGEVAAR